MVFALLTVGARRGRGARPAHRRLVHQAAAAQARVHADLREAPGGVRRRQPRADRAGGARRQHVHAGVLRRAQEGHRRSAGHGRHRPRPRAVAVHAQRALHGSGRGRHRGRQRGRLGVRADARSAGEGAREHPQGRHPRPPGRQRFLRRAGVGDRAREGRHRQTHRPHRGGARARKPRARQDPGQRRARAGAGFGASTCT